MLDNVNLDGQPKDAPKWSQWLMWFDPFSASLEVVAFWAMPHSWEAMLSYWEAIPHFKMGHRKCLKQVINVSKARLTKMHQIWGVSWQILGANT